MLADRIRFTERNNPTHRFEPAAKTAEIVCKECGAVVTHDRMHEGPVYLRPCKGKGKR